MTITVTPISNTQTFGSWLATTNRLANLMTQNTVTSDSSNGGSITTGNSFVNGYFGAEFLYVANTLIGGNLSTNSALYIQANLAVTNGTSNIFVITTNSASSNTRITGNSVIIAPAGNTVVSGDSLTVNTTNVNFTGTSIIFTSSPLSGNITFTSNATFTGASIIANGSLGANGAVLYSNGTGMYWSVIPAVTGNSGIIANADGIFVNANNGLLANSLGLYVVANSGIVSNSTGVFVLANNGVVSNSTGVFVNTAYIATLAANSATGSLTNTFTVGTASYFVANGNLGIGNTTPAHKLRVSGDISLSGGIHANGSLGTANQALFSNGTVAYWANVVGGAILTANNTDSQTFYLPMANATSGSWSNGVISTTKLYFVPSTGTLNATIFNSLSDASQKINIVDVVDGLDKILTLRGVEFNWRENGQKSAGVIAQDVEAVLPHIVATNEAGAKSVNYSAIIAYLISAIRELDEKVRKLENG